MARTTPTVSPAALYLANLSAGSQGMKQPLDAVAKILDADCDADSYLWHELTYRDTMTVRQALIVESAQWPGARVGGDRRAVRGL